MASNASSRKPSSKQLKLDMPQATRIFRQQSTIVSINAKDANRDANKDRDRKLRSITQKSISHTKQRSKRNQVTEALNRATQLIAAAAAATPPPPTPPTPPAPQQAAKATASPLTITASAAAASIQPAITIKPTSTKAASNERPGILARHLEMSQHIKLTRKNKHESAVNMAKAEDLFPNTHTRHPKESKSPHKAETTAVAAAATAQRPSRTKNQCHNSKVFFDKYFKFAYDLTQPDGVRQLEAHFFPTDCYQGKRQSKKSDAGDSPEK